MSLTLGTGPLGGRAPAANYTFESPAHKILFQADDRRLRAFVGALPDGRYTAESWSRGGGVLPQLTGLSMYEVPLRHSSSTGSTARVGLSAH